MARLYQPPITRRSEIAEALAYDASLSATLPHSLNFSRGIPLANQAILSEPFRAMTGLDFLPDDVETIPFQGGYKYGIIRTSIHQPNGEKEYIIHFPRTASVYPEIYGDYNILMQLANNTDRYLSKNGRNVFDVLRPLGILEVLEEDQLIPLLVTPFQRHRHEISLDRHRSAMNILGPAITVDGQFMQLAKQSAQRKMSSKKADLDIILDQNKRLLQATTLLWILLGRKMPSEYQISAGDWLGKCKDDGTNLNFMISTIRGGRADSYPTLEDFLIKLATIKEDMTIQDPSSPIGTAVLQFNPYYIFLFDYYDPYMLCGHHGQLFGSLYPFNELLKDVRNMLKPDSVNEIYPQALYEKDLASTKTAQANAYAYAQAFN